MTNWIKQIWDVIRQQPLIDSLSSANSNLKSELIQKDAELNSYLIDESEHVREDYWNNKWTKSNIIYKAREDAIKFDVRNFITFPDAMLQNILTTHNLSGDTEEDTVLNILKWVNQNITYTTDSSEFGFTEQWDFPAEILYRKKCDCEGYSHLIISLCKAVGIKSYKLKVACGYVKHGTDVVGHSYPIYLREDNEWVAIEGAYYPNSNKIADRIPVREDPNYNPTDKPIWFTFNDKYSWAQTNLTIKPGDV